MHGSLRDCATMTEKCEPLVVELCAAWVQRRRVIVYCSVPVPVQVKVGEGEVKSKF